MTQENSQQETQSDGFWEAKSVSHFIQTTLKNERQTKVCRWIGRIVAGAAMTTILLSASSYWLGRIDGWIVATLATIWVVLIFPPIDN